MTSEDLTVFLKRSAVASAPESDTGIRWIQFDQVIHFPPLVHNRNQVNEHNAMRDSFFLKMIDLLKSRGFTIANKLIVHTSPNKNF